jgi:hypothetical protein
MRKRAKALGLLCGLGTLCQLGGCDLGTITTSMTLDGRAAIIQLVRGAILTPIDAFITETINNAFGETD